MLSAALRDHRLNATLAQPLTMRVGVVAPVGIDGLELLKRSAARATDRRNCVDERQQLRTSLRCALVRIALTGTPLASTRMWCLEAAAQKTGAALQAETPVQGHDEFEARPACRANLLNQDFSVTSPNQAWCGGITYIATDEGWLYLAGLKDLYSGEIVGYAMS
ncbi:hypothetical protein WK65_08115 [Burkholderia ubonensis]|nr:hypothetical protein WK65_08115 [Burkholderia ubonensis]